MLTIAVDGPVGAGKSSVSDAVASRLGILHLDTGAMYRALALAVLRRGLSPQDEQAAGALCDSGSAQIEVDFEQGRQKTLLNGEDVSALIRTQEIGSAASSISRYLKVRRWLVRLQQQIASRQSMLIDGRDIGTVVLPRAKVKIFLTASAERRALRRLRQLEGSDPGLTYGQVLCEINRRDHQDRTRDIDPLRQAEDAVVVDTSFMTFDEAVRAILAIVEDKYGLTAKG